jgi:NADH:ubiquinone oxidoreductase subunit K
MFVLHMVLAGLFMHLYLGGLGLARPARFVGAITYMLSGFVAWRILSGDIPRIATYAWIPLGFYLVEVVMSARRGMAAALLGAVVLAVQCFAGEPQAFTHAALAVSVYAGVRLAGMMRSRAPRAAVRRIALLLAVMLVAGAGFACVQVLPTFESFQNSNRPGFGAGFATLGSIPPIGLISLLAPRFFGDEIHGGWGIELSPEFYPHAASLYTGFFTVVFAATALLARRDRWHVRFFGLFAVAVLWMALGKYGYLYRAAAYVPILRSFRDIENINILLPAAMSVLAAFGFDRLLEADGSVSPWPQVLSTIRLVVAAGGIVVGLALLYYRYHGFELLSLPRVRQTAGESAVFVLAAWGASALLIRARATQRAATDWIVTAAISLIVADLLYSTVPLLSAGTPLRQLAGTDAVTRFLSQDRALYRVSGFFDRGPTFGVQDVGGEPSLLLGRYQEYTDVLQGNDPRRPVRPEGPHGVAIHSGFDSTLMALLNVKYSIFAVTDRPTRLVRDRSRLVPVSDAYIAYRHPKVFARVLAVSNFRVIRNPSALLAELQRPAFDPRTIVLLEEQPVVTPGVAAEAASTGTDTPGRVTVASYDDNEVAIHADFARPGFLVLNDIYYPAWQAVVDGRVTHVYRANYLFRAVPLPPGRHEVRFIYHDRMLALGATIALLTALFGLIALVVERGRHHFAASTGAS